MITGVTKGYEYKMRLVYAHFPININIESECAATRASGCWGWESEQRWQRWQHGSRAGLPPTQRGCSSQPVPGRLCAAMEQALGMAGSGEARRAAGWHGSRQLCGPGTMTAACRTAGGWRPSALQQRHMCELAAHGDSAGTARWQLKPAFTRCSWQHEAAAGHSAPAVARSLLASSSSTFRPILPCHSPPPCCPPLLPTLADKGTKVEIRNFLGEKIVRVVDMLPGVTCERRCAPAGFRLHAAAVAVQCSHTGTAGVDCC